MKKAWPIILGVLVLVVAALILFKRQEKRLRTIYRLLGERLSLKKTPLTVEL